MSLLALPLEMVVSTLKAEYADCGSHQIKLTVDIERDELEALQTGITNLLEEK